MARNTWKTPSRTSPKGGRTRACLCPDGTYSSKCCDGSLWAQGIGNITGTATPTPDPDLLLNLYPNAAAAYSLRKLDKNYDGNAIRIRRASDNSETNIGFVDGQLDTSTLETFCSGTNGFVTTWYDQSGNGYNATQTTSANQPQIVSSGSTILENRKPSVHFHTETTWLEKLSITSFTGFSHVAVATPKTLNTFGFTQFIGLDNFDGAALGVRATLKLYDFNGGIGNINASDNTISLDEQVLLYSQNISDSAELFKNGTSISSATGTTTSENDIIVGNSGNKNTGTKYLQEYILYPSDESSNRSGIESNINNFYNIY